MLDHPVRSGTARTSLRVLFVTWDAPEVSYLESLFVPIFRELRAFGVCVDVLQFRWGTPEQTASVRKACEEAGSRYRSVTILRGGGSLGPLASALAGTLSVHRTVRQFGSEVIMPRGMMPSLTTLLAGGSRLRPMIFDSDGLPADERVEFGGWSASSATYRLFRRVEVEAIRRSASVLVRTSRGAEILRGRAGPQVLEDLFYVVTNGRDERVFSPGTEQERLLMRQQLGIDPAAPLIGYAGSVGPQYRFDALAGFASATLSLRADARLLVLSGSPEQARALLEQAHPAVAERAIVLRVPPEHVPRYLMACDIGAAYRVPSFANQAVAPVKLSEYLLCGVPVVGTASIGDTGPAVEAGVFYDEAPGPAAAAEWFVGSVLSHRDRMRVTARRIGVDNFSLRRSVEDYLEALEPVRSLPALRPA